MLRLFVAVWLVALLPCLARSQPRVSENQYLSILGEGLPALQALTDRVGAARAERARAGQLQNPVAIFEYESPGDGLEETIWGVAWKPPFDARWGASKRAATAGVDAAAHQYESDRLALRAELRRTFADWALAESRSAVVEAHLGLVRELARRMGARASSGEESQLAARRLAFSAVEVEAEAARVAGAAAHARAMAYALHPALPPQAAAELPPLPETDDTLRTAAPPEVLARTSEVEQAEWELKSGGRFLEFPEFAFGWRKIEAGTGSIDGPVVRVTWPVPLFDRQQPDEIRATAQLEAARGRLSLTRARAEAAMLASRSSFDRYRQAALHAMEITDESDRVVESATAAFRLGESRLTDLLETLRSVLAARLAALDLYAAALEAHRSLELAAGRPLIAEEGSR